MLHRHAIFFLELHGHGLLTVSGGLGKLFFRCLLHVKNAHPVTCAACFLSCLYPVNFVQGYGVPRVKTQFAHLDIDKYDNKIRTIDYSKD